jgi:F-type H+-transporting ATPase subunit b
MQITLTPDPSLFAVMVIFILTYIVVRKFFLAPVNAILEAREQETKSADSLYEQALARFNEATAAMEEQVHAARREAAQLREQFRAQAGVRRQTLVEQTTGEARTIVAEADAKLAGDVAAARERIVRDSEALAHMAAERILGRPV